MHVAAFTAVPGVFIRIAGIDPPKAEAPIIPIKRYIAVAGSHPKVKGSTMAIPISPPNPGRAPNISPMKLPPISRSIVFKFVKCDKAISNP